MALQVFLAEFNGHGLERHRHGVVPAVEKSVQGNRGGVMGNWKISDEGRRMKDEVKISLP